MTDTIHQTVLLNESIEGLNIQARINASHGSAQPVIIIDATINGGGHSARMIELYGAKVRILGIDLDEDALVRAKERLDRANERAEQAGLGKAEFSLHCLNFKDMDKVLHQAGLTQVDGILFDLGWSSHQIEQSGRGFTFQKDEPLLMSFQKNPDTEKGELTAYGIINEWSEESLADIIYGYGEERYSRRIAKKIVEAREIQPIQTTFQLVEVIRKAVPFVYTKRKLHFATRTFQALRITVNDEVQTLRDALRKALSCLKQGNGQGNGQGNSQSSGEAIIGGRMAVISFHSIEDRIVKRFFQEEGRSGRAVIVTDKPIIPSEEEFLQNRRSRSAKLRILEKTFSN